MNRLGNLRQRLRRREGFSASLYVPIFYRQDRAEAYESRYPTKKKEKG
jgi:hypothetical protein